MIKDEIIAEKEAIIAKQEAEITQLKFRLAQLEKLIFGQKSEKWKSNQDLDPEQLLLFKAAEAAEEQTDPKEEITYTRTKGGKSHPGRHALPDHLPVEEIVIEPEEDVTGMVKIGEEITDTLDYQEASLKIIRRIRPKYAHPSGTGILIGSLPNRSVPKCLAENGLLTSIIIGKFVDHLPFYRQAQRFKRDFQWTVAESTINDWFVSVCTLMHPLYEELSRTVIQCSYIQADESPIKVLDKDKPGSTHLGYQWVYHSPTDHRVVFQYRKGRGAHGPKEMLSGYRGYVQCDGWKAYEKVARKYSGITLIGCLAHVRRKYHEALKSNPEAGAVLHIIQQMYLQDRKLQDQHLSVEEYARKRRASLLPLFEEWKSWMDTMAPSLKPKETLGKAVIYTRHQWEKLLGILHDGRIRLDNNLIENAIRPLALGRKNYLFAGSHAAAERIAMMYSFLGTCKMCGINPTEWFRITLDKIADWPVNRLEELLPKKLK